MWPSSPANRPVSAGTCLAILLAALAASGADLPALETPDAHYQRCLDQARRAPGDGLAAAEAWHDADGGFPADHCAAVALFGLKRYADAAARFEALAGAMMQRGPDLRADALEEAGQAWLLAGKPDAARADFTAALRFTPADPDLLIDRARAWGQENRFRDAIADLNAALALDAKRADALVYRAAAHRQLGELSLAGADVEAALALAPDDPAAHLERGNLRGIAGDDDGARADWNAVVRLAPGSPAAKAATDNLARVAAPAAK